MEDKGDGRGVDEGGRLLSGDGDSLPELLRRLGPCLA